jgi:hypothetical protein
MMDKVQNLKSSNTAPSSKTFRDEWFSHVENFYIISLFIMSRFHCSGYLLKEAGLSESSSGL